jgi:apolipoprotein D and lipocalin family protein
MLVLGACTGLPEGVQPVTGFKLDRYLGTWYEIARLDHRFERGLDNVTAEYSLRDDGLVKVVNRGYDTDSREWQDAVGKAKFIGSPNVGRLKVSFFGPFYGAYNVFELDSINYEYAMIAGPDRDYLWILARSPSLDQEVLARLLKKAELAGFATDELIYPAHSANRPGQ